MTRIGGATARLRILKRISAEFTHAIVLNDLKEKARLESGHDDALRAVDHVLHKEHEAVGVIEGQEQGRRLLGQVPFCVHALQNALIHVVVVDVEEGADVLVREHDALWRAGRTTATLHPSLRLP